MTTPLSQMPKPEAGQYENNRKLFLVPAFLFSSDTPNEGLELLDRYWSEVRDHVNNLERSLGQVAHVYHEPLYADGDEGWRREQNERLKSQLLAAGSKVATIEIANRTHGSIMSKMGEPDDTAMKTIAAFIKAH